MGAYAGAFPASSFSLTIWGACKTTKRNNKQIKAERGFGKITWDYLEFRVKRQMGPSEQLCRQTMELSVSLNLYPSGFQHVTEEHLWDTILSNWTTTFKFMYGVALMTMGSNFFLAVLLVSLFNA